MVNVQDKVAEMKGIPTEQELVESLKKEVLVVTFDKLSGDERVMTCTKDTNVIPEENHQKDSGREPKPGLINVWDVNAKGYRSFYYDRVKKVEQPQEEE